jgi:hypothetical protein
MLEQQIQLYDEDGNRRSHSSSRSRSINFPNDPEFAKDFRRSRLDIDFFAHRFLGIRGNPGQVAWWDTCSERAEDGWSPKYLTTCCSAGNQAGKTLGISVVAFHHTIHKLGIRPPSDPRDADRFAVAPYEWYHVAIQQEIAEYVHTELGRILSGSHIAQRGGNCPLISECGPVATYAKKYLGDYAMVEINQLFGGGRIHFRTTQEKAKALLGKVMNGISFDEAAFELYLQIIYQEVLNMRRATTGGPLIFIGTPTTGVGDYYDLWEKGNPENPNRDPKFASTRLSTRQNVGFGMTQSQLDDMIAQMDPHLVPQNIDGFFIEAPGAYFGVDVVEKCFRSDLPEEDKPVKDHRYVNGVDPSIALDPSWAVVMDCTDSKNIVGVRARSLRDRQTVTSIVNMAREGHLLFNQDGAYCTTAVDSTGFGGKMYKQELGIISPLRQFDFAGSASKKLQLLANLKILMEKERLHFPREGRLWNELRRQFLSYKLEDKKITQDGVMAVAVGVDYALKNPENATSDRSYSFF